MEWPTLEIRVHRNFEAQPDRVFDAWLDPATVRKWLFASPADESYHARIDARVGGRYAITARRAGKDYTAVGEYVELDRPHRLAFTFAMPQFSPNSDRVGVEISPVGAGCVMTFTQNGVDVAYELRQLSPGGASATEAGWREMFERLAAALG